MTTIYGPSFTAAEPVISDSSVGQASTLARQAENLAQRNDVLSGRASGRRLPKALPPTTVAGLKAPRMTPPRAFTAIGMTDRQALDQSGKPADLLTRTGGSFSVAHDQGDMSNRFSHATIAEVVSAGVEATGLPQWVGTFAGSGVFVAKENIYDLHASQGDYVVTHQVYRTARANGSGESVSATVFGDGAAFVAFRATF